MNQKSVVLWWARLAVGSALFVSAIAHAGHGEETKTMNLGDGGLAIQGYDTVAFFKESDAVKGDAQYQWQGATWYFSSSEHRALFVANPQKYAPQYGGSARSPSA
jgi:YHS domain-containing protein